MKPRRFTAVDHSLVSVIIPTYNRKDLVMRAVESVLNQTYEHFEIVLIDDASTDGTDIYRIGKRDQRITAVAHTENCGVARSRNQGVKRCHGSRLAFLDSDDEWHEEKLEKQMAWMDAHPDFRICQTQEIWIRKGVRVNPPVTHLKREGNIFNESIERCMITPSSVLMTRELFLEMKGFNESLRACEDYDLWLRIASRNSIGLVDEYLLTRYGGHADQLSLTAMPLDLYRIRSLLDLLAVPELTSEQQALAQKSLSDRAAIVAGGFKKRNKMELYEQFYGLHLKYKGAVIQNQVNL